MTVQKIILSYIISLSKGCSRFLLFELSSTVEYLYFQAVNFKQLHCLEEYYE
jgi:hypothetical protein